MALKGFNLATAADESGTDWTGETNCFVSDDTDATDSSQNGAEYLQVTDHDFDLPYNAIIRGVEVAVEGECDTTGANAQIDIGLTKNGTVTVGSEKTNQTLNTVSSTDERQVYGSATDLWGTVWDIDEMNASTFGVRLKKSTASAHTLNIDHVEVRIYYDEGIRGEWDVDFDDQEITHISSHIDYDGGSGGTAPADEDVLYEDTSQTTAKVIGVATGATIVHGTLALGEQHEDNFADNDSLEVCSYVDFDTESNGGLSELNIGDTFAASGGTGTRGGVVRHIWSDGSTGRMWWDQSNETGTALTGDENIQIGGTTYAAAAAAEQTNAWTGAVNGAEITPSQGYIPYTGETVAFESASGSKRIRSSNFQHNMCVLDTTTDATAMLVDDVPDQADSTAGRLYLFDISGTFTATNTVIALEEVSFDAEQNGGFAIGDEVGDAASPTHSWHVRRLIDNGDGTGTLYLERSSGSARFGDNEAIWINGGTQRGTTNGAQRERVGSATIGTGGLVTTNVQWPSSHLYTDALDQTDELLAMEDKNPMKGRVLDQQYEVINDWLIPYYSLRRLKKGEVKQRDVISGTVGDQVNTNFFHLGGLNIAANIYAEQNGIEVEQYWDIGVLDVLLRNKDKNIEIDSGTITFRAHPFGDLYDTAPVTAIGLRNPVGLNTGDDVNNDTSYATVRDDSSKLYHRIMIGWASHTLTFDGGSGTIAVGDVVYNSNGSIEEAAMVIRAPDSVASGSDMHLAFNGQTPGAWADSHTLDLLDYIDFDAQDEQFTIGDAIDNGSGVTANVRFVQQFGGTRGRIWISDVAGGSWSDDDPIEVGATNMATADGDQQTANTWAGAVHTGALASDNTALLDIGQGGDQPYNVHCILNGATLLQFYEFTKFICEERAGDPSVDPGSILYPENTAVQGRYYINADPSNYGAADTKKVAPLGTFAGGKFFGARGIFASDMAAEDVQNYELVDTDNDTNTPPNYQSAVVNGPIAGESLGVYRRYTDTPSGTVTFDTPANTIVINSGGSFDGIRPGAIVTVTGTTSNNFDYTVQTKDSSTQITVEENVVDETTGAGVTTFVSDNINREQYEGHATNNSETDTTFEVTTTISAEEPDANVIIVQHVDGAEIYRDRYTYTGITSSPDAFTGLSPALVRDYDSNARVGVPLIHKVVTTDPETQQIVYGGTPFPVKMVYRKKGIDPIEVDSVFSSTGVIFQVSRNLDGIVE